ncbi:hypothetical protein ACFFRR_008345 [Megaselia abdita]
MKIACLLVFVLVIAIAEPKRNKKVFKIQSYYQDGVRSDGSYKFDYKTENGIHAKEKNDVKRDFVKGSYQYTTPDGKKILVQYVADEYGFHPVISGSGARGLPQAASLLVKSN